MTRTCPISGCTGYVLPGRLLCLHHWRRVPPERQRDVWRSWRIASRSDRRTVSGLTAWEAWERARQAAIDAVERAEESCA